MKGNHISKLSSIQKLTTIIHLNKHFFIFILTIQESSKDIKQIHWSLGVYFLFNISNKRLFWFAYQKYKNLKFIKIIVFSIFTLNNVLYISITKKIFSWIRRVR